MFAGRKKSDGFLSVGESDGPGLTEKLGLDEEISTRILHSALSEIRTGTRAF